MQRAGGRVQACAGVCPRVRPQIARSSLRGYCGGGGWRGGQRLREDGSARTCPARGWGLGWAWRLVGRLLRGLGFLGGWGASAAGG